MANVDKIFEVLEQRDAAWKELRGIRVVTNANAEESTFDEVIRVVSQRNELLAALKESREALQFANDSHKGGINDTLWMMHRPETLFDFMDAAIAKAEGKS